MNKTQRHTAELALIYAVPILSKAEENSRLAGLQRTLQKWAIKDLNRLRHVYDRELEEIVQKIVSWGQKTGWMDNSKQTGALLSFCAGIIESSDFDFNPRIMEIINDIIAHIECGMDFSIDQCIDGSVAADEWEAMFCDQQN